MHGDDPQQNAAAKHVTAVLSVPLVHHSANSSPGERILNIETSSRDKPVTRHDYSEKPSAVFLGIGLCSMQVFSVTDVCLIGFSRMQREEWRAML